MRKKKISFLLFSMGGGGAEKVVAQILHRFSHEYEIVLILFFNEIVFNIPENVKVYVITKETKNSSALQRILNIFKAAVRLKQILKKEDIDNSLSFMYRANFSNVIAKLLGAKSKIILNERSNAAAKTIVFRVLLKYLYPKADMVIPNSFGSAHLLKHSYGISENNIRVIPNPINIEYIDGINLIERVTNKFVFITVGRLIESKNHKMLLNAFSKLKNENKELWILGAGPMENELKQYTKELNITGCVKYHGFQKNPYQYLKAANCFVFPTKYEGLPNALIEALACGLPAISTDCKFGPREIIMKDSNYSNPLLNNIEIGKFGILTPIDNENLFLSAMEEMINNETLYNRYKKEVKSRALDFNKDIVNQKYVEYYFE